VAGGWSAAKLVDGVENLCGFGAGAVVGVDVDPPERAVGVKDIHRGHGERHGPVGVHLREVQSELELGGPGFLGPSGEDAELAADPVAGSETTAKAKVAVTSLGGSAARAVCISVTRSWMIDVLVTVCWRRGRRQSYHGRAGGAS
jgi:hypothetical protein